MMAAYLLDHYRQACGVHLETPQRLNNRPDKHRQFVVVARERYVRPCLCV